MVSFCGGFGLFKFNVGVIFKGKVLDSDYMGLLLIGVGFIYLVVCFWVFFVVLGSGLVLVVLFFGCVEFWCFLFGVMVLLGVCLCGVLLIF